MPTPTYLDQHVDSLLTNLSVAYFQSDTKFVTSTVFPQVPVAKKSDLYATYDRGDFLRDEMEKRAPGSESAGGGYHISTDSYVCDVWAFHKDIADEERANADDPFAPDRDSTTWLAAKRLIRMEKDWVDNYFTTSVWTGSSTGTDLVSGTDFTAWDDTASTPIEDISAQMIEIESNTGYLPNTLVIGRRGWNALKQHPDIVDRIKYTGSAPVSTSLVASLLDLDRVVIPAAVINSAEEQATASVDYMVDDDALLCYSAPSPGLYTPSAGYTFYWTGLTGSVMGQAISTFRLDRNKSDRMEIEAAWSCKVVAPLLGAFFTDIV